MAWFPCNTNNGGEEPKLLWTNASPTATFAAQTVALDLSDYSGVIVEGYGASSEEERLTGRSYIKKSDTSIIFGTSYTDSSEAVFGRKVTVSDTGVTFGAPKQGTTTGNDNNNIPFKIYGVKSSNVVLNENFQFISSYPKGNSQSVTIPSDGLYVLMVMMVSSNTTALATTQFKVTLNNLTYYASNFHVSNGAGNSNYNKLAIIPLQNVKAGTATYTDSSSSTLGLLLYKIS